MSKFDVGDKVIFSGRGTGFEELYEVVFVTQVEGLTGYGIIRVEQLEAGSDLEALKTAFTDPDSKRRNSYVLTVPEDDLDIYRTPVTVILTVDQYKRLRKSDLFRNKPPALKSEEPDYRRLVDLRGADD